MKFHEIIAIGPIYIHKVATKPEWSVADLSRLIYTLDDDQILVGTGTDVGDWYTLANLEGAQTITGVKTFSTLPLLTSDPTEDNHAVRKSYLVSYAAAAYVDMVSDQLSIDGQKGFVLNPLVSQAPTADMELANKSYIDDNFVDIVNNQTINGIKTFLDIPVGPNVNPSADNQLARKRYVDDQVALAGGNQVKISSTDTTASYLATKLVAGSGCTLTTIGASGTNQTLRISLTPSVTGAQLGEIYVSENDTTPGLLASKLVAGEGISLEIGSPSGDEYVEISYNGGQERFVTYDLNYSVGAVEVGKSYTLPAPDLTKSITVSKNSSNVICHSAYEHPAEWTVTPTEDLIVEVRWLPLFPYGSYVTGYYNYYPTLQYLAQTLTWKSWQDTTVYNSGSPDGSNVDWNFFPIMDDYIYVPYDDSAQTFANGVYTPGFNMIISNAFWQKSFGQNYDDGTFYGKNSRDLNASSVRLADQPKWSLGCSPAPTIDTDVQKYFLAKQKVGLKNSYWAEYSGYSFYDKMEPNIDYDGLCGDLSVHIDNDVKYAVLQSGTSYTFKLRSIFGRRRILYGGGSASNCWYNQSYDVGVGYHPTAAGDYTLADIWSMYQGAGTTEVRLKTIAKASLNLP